LSVLRLDIGTTNCKDAAFSAESLSLEPGMVCVVGSHNQCCNALGLGVCSAGKAFDGIGTVECITPIFDGVPDERRMFDAGLSIEHHRRD
jgi:xylulokinase